MLKDHLGFIGEHGQKLSVEILTRGFGSQLKAKRRWSDKLASLFTVWFGTLAFLILNATFFLVWILLNIGVGSTVFDPFPFNLLTMVVSLEAIFLSIIVLISQNTQSKVADLRQRMDFEINIRAEQEITKILQLLAELREHSGLKAEDKELAKMIRKTDLHKMEVNLEKDSM